MVLSKLRKEDLIYDDFCGRIETTLCLDDYDWMDYTLSAIFKTKELGLLVVKFEYYGAVKSLMSVSRVSSGNIQEEVSYEYSSDIFKKHIVKFLKDHIASWDDTYAFSGEDNFVDFYNDVIENGVKLKGDNQ